MNWWQCGNQLKSAAHKCGVLALARNHNFQTGEDMKLYEEKVPRISTVKYLGVLLDQTCGGLAHIGSTVIEDCSRNHISSAAQHWSPRRCSTADAVRQSLYPGPQGIICGYWTINSMCRTCLGRTFSGHLVAAESARVWKKIVSITHLRPAIMKRKDRNHAWMAVEMDSEQPWEWMWKLIPGLRKWVMLKEQKIKRRLIGTGGCPLLIRMALSILIWSIDRNQILKNRKKIKFSRADLIDYWKID